ncbi:uncharacterized protein QC763_509755 [Podospora pseudopauciseta]|uniref:Transmembrane protein n=1 Tax=Podospora pseudopauciseta TaxID=2093780 RepID=A0ABR0HAV3_9PEZI|nr:hypothetical protein QC763_509755 [Podospora pseudopauciseta]
MDDMPPSIDEWFMNLTGNRSTSIVIVAAIVWAVISFLLASAMVCSRAWADDEPKCIRVCQQEGCLFPCYFMLYFLFVFTLPALLVVGLGGFLVVMASGSLSVLPYAAVQKIGIKTCCGVECPCLNLPEFGKENKKAKNKRKTDVDLEVGGESETGRASSAIRGEGAAPGTGLVNSAPQPQVPMVAAPERARTAVPKPSRHTAAEQPRPITYTQRRSRSGGGGSTSQQSRINTSAAQRGSLQSRTLTAENLTILHHRIADVESSQARAGANVTATQSGNETPPPRYEESDTQNRTQ